MRYRRDLLVDVPRNHKSSNATRLKLCKIRRHKKLVSILPRADMENIERERERKGRENGRKIGRVEGFDFDAGKTFSSWLVELCRESDAVFRGGGRT